ncbi:hypothetical protein CGCA056_v000942 [Colletotrichum aenigma]|uniref:uncharacterized protein n=1 Tax=Colletotrichum aenigma TaxID=1215731 RepID=UPI001872F9C4|nr:uncharacterized protein CGCA056_v000942 [Colletotrichum aenigma]KAF5527123.1 hypothetical protein CGCA056_v000942 [Colletotrichum aenigma]
MIISLLSNFNLPLKRHDQSTDENGHEFKSIVEDAFEQARNQCLANLSAMKSFTAANGVTGMLKANGKSTPDAVKPTPQTLESAVETLSATTDRTTVAKPREDAITKGTNRGSQFDALDSDEEKQFRESKRADLRDQRVAASTAKRLVHFISDMAKDPEEVQIQVIQRCFLDSTLQDFVFEAELTLHTREVVMSNAKRQTDTAARQSPTLYSYYQGSELHSETVDTILLHNSFATV